MNDRCELCAEIAGGQTRFHEIYGGVLRNREIAASQNFVLWPSLGQLGDAHLMIVSRHHKTAVALLDDDERSELRGLVERTKSWLRMHRGQHTMVFENGDPMGSGRMGCTISHLHMHVVVSDRPFTKVASSIRLLGGTGVNQMPTSIHRCGPYSYAEFDFMDALLVPTRLPSQTLRRLVARDLGHRQWDWRLAGQEEQLIDIVALARNQLADRSVIGAS